MSNLLVMFTGSIACYKACDVISQLVQRGHRVRTVATESALRFVGATTLEALTGEEVASDLFAPGAALDHIGLSRWADLTVVCPATAHTLNRMAAGLADDLAGALLLAHDWKKPLLIAPAMNPMMWSHPATTAAVEKLRGWGAVFVAPGTGRTACGEEGEGRLAETGVIVDAVEAALARPALRLRVLITSGGTAEPVDGVRVLTNTSTGRTGVLIAEHFARAGHDVVLLRARSAGRPAGGVREETFGTFGELDSMLSALLGAQDFDAVIHAAAVGDFSVVGIEIGGVRQPPGSAKLDSGTAPILHLRSNPKLLDTLRARSRKRDPVVVAFKLTCGAGPEQTQTEVAGLFANGAADFVVHNDHAARQDPAGAFPAEIWAAQGGIVAHCADRAEIGPALERLLAARCSDTNKPGLSDSSTV